MRLQGIPPVFVAIWCLLHMAIARILSEQQCLPTYADCQCGSDDDEHTIQPYIDTAVITDKKTGKSRCIATLDPVSVCESYNCTIYPNENFDTLFAGGVRVIVSNSLEEENMLHSKDFNFFGEHTEPVYPIEIIMKKIDSPDSEDSLLSRNRRFGECQMMLKNAYVTCWKWPNYQTCHATCPGASTFVANGRSTQRVRMTCRNSENFWKPPAIQDCSPFLPCKPVLISPGTQNCKMLGNAPRYCDISCFPYDGRRGVGMMRVPCSPDFARNLPYCAALDKSVLNSLAPRPLVYRNPANKKSLKTMSEGEEV